MDLNNSTTFPLKINVRETDKKFVSLFMKQLLKYPDLYIKLLTCNHFYSFIWEHHFDFSLNNPFTAINHFMVSTMALRDNIIEIESLWKNTLNHAREKFYKMPLNYGSTTNDKFPKWSNISNNKKLFNLT